MAHPDLLTHRAQFEKSITRLGDGIYTAVGYAASNVHMIEGDSSITIIDTSESTKAFGPKVAKNIARAGRPGYPSEIADVILYLASAQSAWIKGQDITIDGGMSAMGMTDMMELKG